LSNDRGRLSARRQPELAALSLLTTAAKSFYLGVQFFVFVDQHIVGLRSRVSRNIKYCLLVLRRRNFRRCTLAQLRGWRSSIVTSKEITGPWARWAFRRLGKRYIGKCTKQRKCGNCLHANGQPQAIQPYAWQWQVWPLVSSRSSCRFQDWPGAHPLN
jgi:hypothetical protein